MFVPKQAEENSARKVFKWDPKVDPALAVSILALVIAIFTLFVRWGSLESTRAQGELSASTAAPFVVLETLHVYFDESDPNPGKYKLLLSNLGSLPAVGVKAHVYNASDYRENGSKAPQLVLCTDKWRTGEKRIDKGVPEVLAFWHGEEDEKPDNNFRYQLENFGPLVLVLSYESHVADVPVDSPSRWVITPNMQVMDYETWVPIVSGGGGSGW